MVCVCGTAYVGRSEGNCRHHFCFCHVVLETGFRTSSFTASAFTLWAIFLDLYFCIVFRYGSYSNFASLPNKLKILWQPLYVAQRELQAHLTIHCMEKMARVWTMPSPVINPACQLLLKSLHAGSDAAPHSPSRVVQPRLAPQWTAQGSSIPVCCRFCQPSCFWFST